MPSKYPLTLWLILPCSNPLAGSFDPQSIGTLRLRARREQVRVDPSKVERPPIGQHWQQRALRIEHGHVFCHPVQCCCVRDGYAAAVRPRPVWPAAEAGHQVAAWPRQEGCVPSLLVAAVLEHLGGAEEEGKVVRSAWHVSG